MTLPMTTLDAFAAIPLAAVCCDQTFGKDEARVIREQLLGRTAYQEMEPYAFALLISGLLKRFREDSWQGLIASAAPLLSPEQQEMAFALACQLIHCDRIVAPQEQQFLAALAQQLQFTTDRAEQIFEVCHLLNRDFVNNQST
ncbi:tellurite resistance TerB family protein [Cyanobium sp. WKJ7-Wakatipu]|uniref:tellurite resistance TerB family protein n=1 Tax=Cyanobium sp. WKJ7-Wakatipu TaxID=2823726 RepID=UPI0020CC4D82|nr:tellurite resistance TerB family protein [Cyanobium sp. WKJ7-Wakatipu]MCP9783963.1 tellurite resistance TerB family protein [Cyanobium sp. WKJ7-Wakatipu]